MTDKVTVQAILGTFFKNDCLIHFGPNKSFSKDVDYWVFPIVTLKKNKVLSNVCPVNYGGQKDGLMPMITTSAEGRGN